VRVQVDYFPLTVIKCPGRLARMPYRFKIDEPVEKGFRRIVREQLDVALQELAAPEVQPKGVHECRKALKRLRALFRLVGPALGKNEARRRIKALSKIARLLAGRRDQTVLVATVSKLASETGVNGASMLAPLKTHFANVSEDNPHLLDADCTAKARLLLFREVRKSARASLSKRGFAALEAGLEKSYRQARTSMKVAYSEPSDETFHTLRKSVQWHWRQMSLLARAWPGEFAVRVDAARELSQILGDDHDLAMLIGATAKAENMSYDDKEAIITVCLRKQQALRAAAEYRVERLFAESPKAFMKRMGAYWKFARVVPASDLAPIIVKGDGEAGERVAGTEGRPAAQDIKPVPPKPRLAAKSAVAAPSQRRG
jgi:CHAD domain-containing protein